MDYAPQINHGPSFIVLFKRQRRKSGHQKVTVYEKVSWQEAYNTCRSLGRYLPFTRSMDDVEMLVALVQHKAFNLRMPIFLGRQPQVIQDCVTTSVCLC